MKNNITTIVLVSIIGLGVGYFVGMNSAGMATTSKDMDDAIVMMKKQSVSIEQMAEMMKSSGVMMQELGVTYKNDIMMSNGKDMEAVGVKYMQENTKESAGGDSMNRMMSN